jgi:hypothetical protein
VVAIIGKPEAEQSHRTMLARLYWDPAKRFTLLHLAAVQNAVPFAQLLLREGALPNAQACRRPPPSLSPHESIQIYSKFRTISPTFYKLLLPNAYLLQRFTCAYSRKRE